VEGLLFILGIAALLWVLATPFLLVSHMNLKSRVRELSAQLGRLETQGRGTARTATEPVTVATPADVPDVAPRAEDLTATDETVAEDAPVPSDVTPEPIAASVVPPPAPEGTADDATPKAFVFRKDKMAEFTDWMKENWVLAAGAASLSLAGVFLVQYGAERGLLTPFWRVMAAIAFGIALMVGGEVIRRRFGGDTEGDTRFLPSALSGAGLLTLFAAVLSARVLYDLIGPGQAFVGLALVSAIGMVFGWFYGPVLTVVGILGAASTPYLVGGSSDTPWMMQYYFALIALTALAIDAFKRWAWVSVLALIATLSSIWFLFIVVGFPEHFIAATLIIAAGAIVIPERRTVPAHDGPPVLALFWGARPAFPTRLSFAVTLNAAVAALAVSLVGVNLADAYLGLVVIALIALATTLWMWKAPALADHAVLPVLAFLGLVAAQALFFGPMFEAFRTSATRPPETAPSAIAWHLLGVAGIMTLLLFWRMPKAGMPLVWAFTASSLAPLTVFLLEFLWDPALVYGKFPWALTVSAVAAVMTLLAERAARLKVAHKTLIVSLFAVAAVSLIGLSLFLILTKTALTLGLATMILLVTLLDRRFNLPILGLYGAIGSAVITYRLVIDPGLDWATRSSTPLLQVMIAYAGTMAILAAAWWVARQHRPRLSAILESTIWVLAAVFTLVLFDRLLPDRGLETHWGLGLMAAVWTVMALAQLHRMQGAAKFERICRWIVASVLAVMTLLTLGARFVFANPLDGSLVIGPPVLNSLALAYLPLAIVLALAVWKISHLQRFARIGLGLISAFYFTAYIGLAIRHAWRGPDLSVPGFSDPELYSYTVAMLLAAAATMFVAFWRRAVWLRKLAMAGIALTIAKVFFIDMAGLSGLIRVLSFMGLGLALLALTWLDRVMSAAWEKAEPPDA
jgi:uncharacterized membrane protein